MYCENQQVVYCVDDEYRVYCDVSDKLYIERFYKNHLKSQTHTNNISSSCKQGNKSVILFPKSLSRIRSPFEISNCRSTICKN